jgi:anti-sigma factor RsiW
MSDARTRIDELLLARVTEDLSAAEASELERLLSANPDIDTTAYDWAAAIVSLASLDTLPAMPLHLRTALEARAAEFVAERAKSQS